jgi:hypothetical protein
MALAAATRAPMMAAASASWPTMNGSVRPLRSRMTTTARRLPDWCSTRRRSIRLALSLACLIQPPTWQPSIRPLPPVAGGHPPPVPPYRPIGQDVHKASKIQGARGYVRQTLFMPAMAAARFNADMKAKLKTLIKTGKPAKVAITAVMRKLVVLANALLRDDRLWTPKPA